MKIREISTDGYENGAGLAQAWQREGLLPSPMGEVYEFYRLVDREWVEKLGDLDGAQGPEWNPLEYFERRARRLDNQRDLETLRGWNDQKVVELVGEIHEQRLAATFDPIRFPEMQGLAAYVDAESKGVADVFGTDFRRILLCKDEYNRLVYTRILQVPEAEEGHCTSCAFKESPVGPVIGRNMDSGYSALAGLQTFGEPSLYRYPEEMGHSYLGPTVHCNEHGMVSQGSSIGYPHEETNAGFWVGLQELISQHCRTVAEGLDLIDRYSGMSGPSNMLLLDGNGDAAVVEKTKRSFAVRRTQAPWIFTTDGIAVEEKTAAIQGDGASPEHAFHRSRHDRLQSMLEEKGQSPGVDAMSRIIRDHWPESPVCKHIEEMPDHYQLTTLYSYILVPQAGELHFWVTRPGPVYPCAQEATVYPFSFD